MNTVIHFWSKEMDCKSPHPTNKINLEYFLVLRGGLLQQNGPEFQSLSFKPQSKFPHKTVTWSKRDTEEKNDAKELQQKEKKK